MKDRISSFRQIAESILGPVEWTESDRGLCRCPGQVLHTHPEGPRDCQVIVSGAPTVFCFHQSCAGAVEQANRELRQRLGRGTSNSNRQLAHAKPSRSLARKPADLLARRAESAKSRVFADFAWSLEEMAEDSACRPIGHPDRHWRQLLGLFPLTDILWIGSIYESGPQFKNRFRSVAEWLELELAPAQFICPNPIRPGEFSRSAKNLATCRFLVVESDELSKTQMAAVFRWLRSFLSLRAIVDTAGKSLHGWFEYPEKPVLEELKIILPVLGCDRALFRPCQPVRLPGARRGENFQKLLWLKGGAHE